MFVKDRIDSFALYMSILPAIRAGFLDGHVKLKKELENVVLPLWRLNMGTVAYMLLLDHEKYNSPEKVPHDSIFQWPAIQNKDKKVDSETNWPVAIKSQLECCSRNEPFKRDDTLRPLRLFHQLYVLCDPAGAPDLKIYKQADNQWERIKKLDQMWDGNSGLLYEPIHKWQSAFIWHETLEREKPIHRVRRALEFFDAASYIGNLYVQIVVLVSGMETLFTREMTKTGEKLANRLTGMLYSSNDATERQNTRKKILDLYDFRSKIVHYGGPDFEKSDAIPIRSSCVNYLRNCIAHLLSSKNDDYKYFNSDKNHKNFMNCLDRRM